MYAVYFYRNVSIDNDIVISLKVSDQQETLHEIDRLGLPDPSSRIVYVDSVEDINHIKII